MAGKDIITNRLITDEDVLEMQGTLRGNYLRPGERHMIVLLLDVSTRIKEQNELLVSLEKKLAVSSPDVIHDSKPKAERPKLA